MAASSLARQLGALQPEKRTRRGQASLLFDDREAENYDVQTIFEIGLAGFSELCRADAQFRQWESSLFSTSAAEFDRDLQTAEVNATLDASLSSFFKALCPHYLQRGAHKAMEFLIRRFRVHVYNVDDIMACILPHHETLIFARTVAILQFSDTGLWGFLRGVKKTGAPLNRSMLVQQLRKDEALLTFMADSALHCGAESESVGHPTVKAFLVCCTELLQGGTGPPSAAHQRILLSTLSRGLAAEAPAGMHATCTGVAVSLATAVPLSQDIVIGLATAMTAVPGTTQEEVATTVAGLAALYAAAASHLGWDVAAASVPPLPVAGVRPLLRAPGVEGVLEDTATHFNAEAMLAGVVMGGLHASLEHASIRGPMVAVLARAPLPTGLAGQALSALVAAHATASASQAKHLQACVRALATSHAAEADAALTSVLSSAPPATLEWLGDTLSGTAVQPVVLVADADGKTSALALAATTSHASPAVRAQGLEVLLGLVPTAAAEVQGILEGAGLLGSAGAGTASDGSGSDTSEDEEEADAELAGGQAPAAGLGSDALHKLAAALTTLALGRRVVAERLADDEEGVVAAATQVLRALVQVQAVLPPCLAHLQGQLMSRGAELSPPALTGIAANDAAWLAASAPAMATPQALAQASADAVAMAAATSWVAAACGAMEAHCGEGGPSPPAVPAAEALFGHLLPALGLGGTTVEVWNAATPAARVTAPGGVGGAAMDLLVARSCLTWWSHTPGPQPKAATALLQAVAAAAPSAAGAGAVVLLAGAAAAAGGRKGRVTLGTLLRSVAAVLSGPAPPPHLLSAVAAVAKDDASRGCLFARLALATAVERVAGGASAAPPATPSRRSRRRSRGDSIDSVLSASVGVASTDTAVAVLAAAADAGVQAWTGAVAQGLQGARAEPLDLAALCNPAGGEDAAAAAAAAVQQQLALGAHLLALVAGTIAATTPATPPTVSASVSGGLGLQESPASIVGCLLLTVLATPSVPAGHRQALLARLLRPGTASLPSIADAAEGTAAPSSVTVGGESSSAVGGCATPVLSTLVTAPSATVPPLAAHAALLALCDLLVAVASQLGTCTAPRKTPSRRRSRSASSESAATAAAAPAAALHKPAVLLAVKEGGAGGMGELPHLLALLPFLLSLLLGNARSAVRAAACDALEALAGIAGQLVAAGISAEDLGAVASASAEPAASVSLAVTASATAKLVALRLELSSDSDAAKNALGVLLGSVSTGGGKRAAQAARRVARASKGKKRSRKPSVDGDLPSAVEALSLPEEEAAALAKALALTAQTAYASAPHVSGALAGALARVKPGVVWEPLQALAHTILDDLQAAQASQATTHQAEVLTVSCSQARALARIQAGEGVPGALHLVQHMSAVGDSCATFAVQDAAGRSYEDLALHSLAGGVLTQDLWEAAAQVPPPASLLEALPSLQGDGPRTAADALLVWLTHQISAGSTPAAVAARAVLVSRRLPASQLVWWLQALGMAGPAAVASASQAATPSSKKARKAAAKKADDAPSGCPPPLLAALAPTGKSDWSEAAVAAVGAVPAVAATRLAVVVAEVLVAKVGVVAVHPDATGAEAPPGAGDTVQGVEGLLAPLLHATADMVAGLAPLWAALAAAGVDTTQDIEGARASALSPLAQDCTQTLEFALQLLLAATHALLARLAPAQGTGAPQPAAALVPPAFLGPIVDTILGAASAQARTAALRVLATAAALQPKGVLRRILPVFLAVGTSADVVSGAASTAAFHTLASILGYIVPCVVTHGPSVGLSLPHLLRVFTAMVDALPAGGVTHLLSTLVSTSAASQALVDARAVTEAAGAGNKVTSKQRKGRQAALAAQFTGGLMTMLLSQAVRFHGARPDAPPTVAALDVAACLPIQGQVASLVEVVAGTRWLVSRFAGEEAEEEEEEGGASLEACVQDRAAFMAPPSPARTFLGLATGDDASLLKSGLLNHVEASTPAKAQSLPASVRAGIQHALDSFNQGGKAVLDTTGGQALVLAGLQASQELLTSHAFVTVAASTARKGGSSMSKLQSAYLHLADGLFSSLASAAAALEVARHAPPSPSTSAACKWWSTVVDAAYGALTALSDLLPVSAFVALVSLLLQGSTPTVRRRALVFLNRRLEADVEAGLAEEDVALYLELVSELVTVLRGDAQQEGAEEAEDVPTRTTAALSLHILAGHFAKDHAAEFSAAAHALVVVLDSGEPIDKPSAGRGRSRGQRSRARRGAEGATPAPEAEDAGPADVKVEPPALRSTCALALSTLIAKAPPLLIQHFPTLMPRLLADGKDLLSDVVSAASAEEEEVAGTSLRNTLTALAAVASHMPKFLSRFVKPLLRLTLHPALLPALPTPHLELAATEELDSDSDSDSEGDDAASTASSGTASSSGSGSSASTASGQGAASSALRRSMQETASSIREAVAGKIPSRVLLPHLKEVLPWAADETPASAVAALAVLRGAVQALARADVAPLHTQVHAMVVTALDYRWLRGQAADVGAAGCTAVEGAAIDAFLALVLHLSESQLRPLLLRLTAWRSAEDADLALASEGVGVWGVEGADGPVLDLAEQGTSPAAAATFAFAGLCRRISFYRLLAGLTHTLKSIAVPMYEALLPDLAAELLALTAVAGENAGGARGVKRPRAQIHSDASDDDSSDDSDAAKKPRRSMSASPSSASDSETEDASEEDEGSETASGSGSAESDSDSDSDSEVEDAGAWAASLHPAVRANSSTRRAPAAAMRASLAMEHTARPVVHADLAAGTAEVLPSASHSLRCCLLGCLAALATNDAEKWMNKERLQHILIPLVAQFELPLSAAAGPPNALVGSIVPVPRTVPEDSPAAAAAAAKRDLGQHAGAAQSGYRAFVQAYLLPVLGSLVTALGDDMLWKRLNHSLLMLTRDSRPRVRLAGLWGVQTVFVRGREDALVLLPETIPFLAEAMEDADPEVEACTNALVRSLEEMSGESLQEFLTR